MSYPPKLKTPARRPDDLVPVKSFQRTPAGVLGGYRCFDLEDAVDLQVVTRGDLGAGIQGEAAAPRIRATRADFTDHFAAEAVERTLEGAVTARGDEDREVIEGALEDVTAMLAADLTAAEETVVAVHEAGHAICALNCPHAPPIQRISIRGDLAELRGDRVRFADGSEEPFDVIVYATGYRVSFPFLRPEVIDPAGNEVRLYRQVVHTEVPGLYFIGEVVDVTGHLGGFNFQWAWSSGWAAGQVA